jgi:hypothetical protein
MCTIPGQERSVGWGWSGEALGEMELEEERPGKV